MNEHDSERIAGVLASEGMEPTEVLEDADVVVFNTCCIRENADKKFYGHLGAVKALRESRPGMQVAVGGCLAQKDREQIVARAGHVDAVFGTFNVGAVGDLLRRAQTDGPQIEVLDQAVGDELDSYPAALPAQRQGGHAAWVTIQVGCDNSCAFCIVPQVRGAEASRPFGDILAEVERLASTGVVEVTLLGQNVNSYGRDLTVALRHDMGADVSYTTGEAWATASRRSARPLFGDLLRATGAVEGIRRVRFISPHPKDLRPETIAAMAETEEVCNQLHLPLQSGSDRVLSAMRRGYTAERYLARLAAARSAIEDLAVSTDVIVGFPGETEEDFQATLEVVAEAAYDGVFIFQFSPRPGTIAAGMEEDFVPQEVISERFARLEVVADRSALARHRARIGRVEHVLVEGPSKRDPTRWSARTTQHKLVHLASGEGISRGAFVDVKITAAGAHHLQGEVVGRPERPRRIRLELAG